MNFNSIYENEIKEISQKVYTYLNQKLDLKNFKIFRAMPSPIDKIQNRYRWRLIVKGKMTDDSNIVFNKLLRNIYQLNLKNTRVSIDINPNNMI